MKTLFTLILIAAIAFGAYKIAIIFQEKNASWQGSKLQKEAGASGQCFYEGKIYNRGEIFDSKDSCNTCKCQNDPLNIDKPKVACTERACL